MFPSSKRKKPRSKKSKKKKIILNPASELAFFPKQLGTTGFPPRGEFCLDFRQAVRVTSSASPYFYSFRLNSIYDPDYAVGGNQPLYTAQLAAVYQYYCVHHADFSIDCYNNSSTQDTQVVVFPTVFAAASGSLDAVAMRPLSTEGVCGRIGSTKTDLHIRRKFNISQLFGQPLIDDNFSALFTANPLNVAYVNVAFQNLFSAGITPNDLYAVVHLRFYVTVRDLVQVTSS